MASGSPYHPYMGYANGRLPDSALSPIPGSGPYGTPQLRNDAAVAYNALDDYSRRRWGISMALHESSVGRAYRSYARQVLAKQVYGRNAAFPGTSGHGDGLRVDLMTRQQRWVMDQIGHLFGFSKRWSDAAWEWWHIAFRPGFYSMVEEYKDRTRLPRTVRRGSRGRAVQILHSRLRRRGHKRLPGPGEKGYSYFGKKTQEVVKKFQRTHGLRPADGIVGPATWRKLRRRR